MGKAGQSRLEQGAYRDDPDRDDAASTSSAVPLGDIDFPEADPPAYEEIASTAGQPRPEETYMYSSLIPPSIPASHRSRDEITTTTYWPYYSDNAEVLKDMLEAQAECPPTLTARITGTHSETIKRKEKDEKTTVTDFDVRLDMTHLVLPGPNTPRFLVMPSFHTVDGAQKAYRGNQRKTIEQCDGALDKEAYIQSYVSSHHPVRSLTFERHILYFDSAALEKLLVSLVRSTNYRGHLNITFPITNRRVRVYSPCWQNRYREKWWVRWFFYLTFLWIFSWPYLSFVTRRWEVFVADFPYSCSPECGNRRFVTKSEEEFFQEWKASIRRAIMGKMQGWIDEEYKLVTEEQQGGMNGMQRMPSTGNANADAALGFLQTAVSVGRGVSRAGGWGADS